MHHFLCLVSYLRIYRYRPLPGLFGWGPRFGPAEGKGRKGFCFICYYSLHTYIFFWRLLDCFFCFDLVCRVTVFFWAAVFTGLFGQVGGGGGVGMGWRAHINVPFPFPFLCWDIIYCTDWRYMLLGFYNFLLAGLGLIMGS